jgi:hypothetical protein
VSLRSVPLGVCVGLMAFSSWAAADERRVVVFQDGAKPTFTVEGDRFARGPIDLEVRLAGTNPLCYRYRTKIDDKDVTPRASSAPAAPTAPARPSAAPRSFTTATEAREALDVAAKNLAAAVSDARKQLSLDAAWAGCALGANPSQHVQSAASALAKNGGPSGSWSRAISDAQATAEGVLELAKTSGAQRADQPQEMGTRRRAVEQAAQNLQMARERLDEATKKNAKDKADHESNFQHATTELERARRELADAEARGAELAGMPALEADARRLLERSEAAGQTLDTLSADVARANTLNGAPTSIKHRVRLGESVRVTVEKQPIEHRLQVEDAAAESFTSPAVESLQPIWVDVGFGPALTLGRNTSEWEVIHRENRLVGARSEQELIMDGLLSFSLYIYGPRYLDDTVFDPMQLIPRPMAGISLTEPTTSAYAGLQIDPLQFVDISGGIRWHTVEKRIGWKSTDDELVQPEEIATKKEVTPSAFVAVTFSTDLFWRWIKREVK